jgi:hypothetical protein
MRYINELILKGGVKCVSLLLTISIDYDHMFLFFFCFFFHACRCINRVGLEESGGYCHNPNPKPRFATMIGMLILSLNLILTRTNKNL